MTHVLPDLPYAYNALEPYISSQIMELHHKKHHQTYVNALNAAEAKYAQAPNPKERIALQAALKFNGGGPSINFHIMHGRKVSPIFNRTHQPLPLLEESCTGFH
jgi:superoxide dismutase